MEAPISKLILLLSILYYTDLYMYKYNTEH